MKNTIEAEKLDWDEQIIYKVLNGHTDAYEHLIRKYNQRLFRTGISYLQDENDVEDAMQSTYLKAFEALGRFTGKSQFATWLTRIMINECLQLLRKQKPVEGIDLERDLPEEVITIQNAEDELIKKEMKLILEKSILKLPPKYRVVYMMREVEGMSTLKTAATLEISESNVKARLARAKNKLREEIMSRSGEVEVFEFGNDKCDMLVKRVMSRIL